MPGFESRVMALAFSFSVYMFLVMYTKNLIMPFSVVLCALQKCPTKLSNMQYENSD